VCTKEAVCSVAPLTSSFHWVSNGRGIGNWKRNERDVSGIVSLALSE
jgi:hypothetical protein